MYLRIERVKYAVGSPAIYLSMKEDGSEPESLVMQTGRQTMSVIFVYWSSSNKHWSLTPIARKTVNSPQAWWE